MASGISSDRELTKAIEDFFIQTDAALCKTPESMKTAMDDLLRQRKPNRMVDGLVFDVSPILASLQDEIVQRVCRIVGPIAGDEDFVARQLWSDAVKRLKEVDDVSKAVQGFLIEVEEKTSEERKFIVENSIIYLGDVIEVVEIGPVTIAKGSSIAAQINHANERSDWRVDVGTPGFELSEDLTGRILIDHNVWSISAVAAKANLAEEAAWLAGVTVSLLRVTISAALGMMIGRRGEIEPHPFRRRPLEAIGISLDRNGISQGGMSRAPRYCIDQEAFEYISTKEFQAIVGKLFGCNKKSIGARVRQSLGWLAKGRQCEDRAERFLYFFTALEALLSSDDKTAPVVQTIARNAASILTNNVQGRADNAKLIKNLYAGRSALVHTGTRSVTVRQANTIEAITEVVCWRILDQVDLGQSVEAFQAELLNSSYGLKWGDEAIHLLPVSSSQPLPEPVDDQENDSSSEDLED